MPSAESPRPIQLLVGTNNKGKLREFRRLLEPLAIAPLSLAEIGLDLDVEETGTTFAENALLKALAFAKAAGMPALADDSGLEVDALDGGPGVRSARWVSGSDEDRLLALLDALRGVSDEKRLARYRAVVCLANPAGRFVMADGVVEGRILREPRGDGGFGYDPIFLPLVSDAVRPASHGLFGERSMAEISVDEKDGISHRARALSALEPTIRNFLSETHQQRAR